MEEETTQKTIALVMDGAKLSARELRCIWIISTGRKAENRNIKQYIKRFP